MEWTKEFREAFLDLKDRVCKAPVLTMPNSSREFILDTDVRNTSIGAVLSRNIDGVKRPVAYASRTLSKAERHLERIAHNCLRNVVLTADQERGTVPVVSHVEFKPFSMSMQTLQDSEQSFKMIKQWVEIEKKTIMLKSAVKDESLSHFGL